MNGELVVPSGVLFGAICALIASGRGRSGLAWFFLGLFLQCFGLIALLVLPDLRAEEMQHEELVTENRKLRERIRKERQVAAHRHAATQRRIDAHDRALRMDTGGMLGADTPDLIASPEQRESFERSLWFYLIDQQQSGPVAFGELKRVWRDGGIGPENYVWRDGMPDWLRVKQMRELEAELRA